MDRMTTRLESKLNKAYDNITGAKTLIEKKLEKETNPKTLLYLKDYKIELFDIQLRIKDMQRNRYIIEGEQRRK